VRAAWKKAFEGKRGVKEKNVEQVPWEKGSRAPGEKETGRLASPKELEGLREKNYETKKKNLRKGGVFQQLCLVITSRSL